MYIAYLYPADVLGMVLFIFKFVKKSVRLYFVNSGFVLFLAHLSSAQDELL